MKKTILASDTPEIWAADALYNKSQRYFEKMSSSEGGSWEYGLWSSLGLELLARSALSNINPALLADYNKASWSSLYNSLGFTPIEAKFSPKSISITDVLNRLTQILPNFDRELESFCKLHISKRNSELHSGESSFEGVPVSTWHPSFFKSAEVFLTSMGLTLEELFGEDEAKAARTLIEAAADESAKSVISDVEAYRKVWLSKESADQDNLKQSSTIWATRQMGHRVKCPACECASLVSGDPVSVPTQKLENDIIVEKQEILPTHFECVACGLRISGISRLNVVGLSDRFINTQHYDAAEYYAPEDEYHEYEPDNNEQF